MRSEHHPTRSRYWLRLLFQFVEAFLLGIPVGFLFRPFSTQNVGIITPIPPEPLFLSLWGFWQFPVGLFFSIMLMKTLHAFIWKRQSISGQKVFFTVIVLLGSLLLIICGIAPEESLRMMGLLSNSTDQMETLYSLLNPFVVGLAISFILEETSMYSFSLGKAIVRAGIGWTGTMTLFLLLVNVYAQDVSLLCFHWFCTIPIILEYAPIEFLIGLIIAMIGGVVGGLLCHSLLGRSSDKRDIERKR